MLEMNRCDSYKVWYAFIQTARMAYGVAVGGTARLACVWRAPGSEHIALPWQANNGFMLML